MKLEAFALVLSGALLHVIWNYYAKKAAGGPGFVWLYGLVSLALGAPVVAWYLLERPELFGPALGAVALASAGLHVLYALVLQQGYRESDFSIVYPLARGSGPLFAVCGAMLLLFERPGWGGGLGIALVLLGMLLLVGGGLSWNLRDARMRRGLAWGLLTGLFIAAYTVLDGWSVKVLQLPPLLFYSLGLACRTVLLAPFVLRRGADVALQWRRNRRHVLVVGLLSPAAYTLVLFAMTLAPLSYVAPTRELSMMIGAFVGARLLDEQALRSRLLGTVLMALGILALTLA